MQRRQHAYLFLLIIFTYFFTAGRLDSNTRQSGDILINGHKQELAYGTSVW